MLPDINLLPKYDRQNSLTYILFLIGLFLGLIVLIGLIVYYFYIRGSLEDTSQRLSQVQQEKQLFEEQFTKLELEETDTFQTVYTYIDQQIVPTSYLIDELINRLPDSSYLSRFNYNYQTVDIETQFETMSDTATYVEELIRSEYVHGVKVDQVNTFELDPIETTEEESDDIYDTVPRYHVSYSLEVNHAYLKEVGKSDE